MRTVLGVALGATAVRAVAVQGGAVRWALEVTCAPEDDLPSVLKELFQRVPLRRRLSRPGVIIAVDASRAQVKRIAGLPPMIDREALALLVREGASRFFLRNAATPLITSDVRLVGPGIAWAAAVESPLVTELERACEAAKLRLRAVAPTAVVLRAALEPMDGTITWRDGDITLVLTIAADQLVNVRRLAGERSRAASSEVADVRVGGRMVMDGDSDNRQQESEAHLHVPHPVKHLASLGVDAWRFADAYGAARLPSREPLAFHPGRDAIRAGSGPRWRRTLAECACIASVTAALLAPGIAATRASRAASVRLAALGARRAEAMTTERELNRVTEALARAAEFERSRTSATRLLRTITTALPTGSALVTLRVDTTAGTLVALAPRAGAVVNALDHTPGISAPAILGPVTRETAGALELERVTIRFQVDTSARTTVAGSRGRTATPQAHTVGTHP